LSEDEQSSASKRVPHIPLIARLLWRKPSAMAGGLRVELSSLLAADAPNAALAARGSVAGEDRFARRHAGRAATRRRIHGWPGSGAAGRAAKLIAHFMQIAPRQTQRTTAGGPFKIRDRWVSFLRLFHGPILFQPVRKNPTKLIAKK